ncbi:MAG TPA: threonine/serine dehydratase [Gemmatimonadales bacterium]
MTVAARVDLVTLDDIRAAARRLSGVAVRTPLLPVDDLTELLGVPVYIKPENLQRVGAFKLRGAYNLVSQLAAEGSRGVITYSSGNHGQATAYAAKKFGMRAVIVMPETVTAAKRSGVERLGGEVVLAGRTSDDRFLKAMEIAESEALAVVPPFDHPAIIAGQGTVGLEICDDLPDVRAVIVPTGGGGLSAGVATAVKALARNAMVVTVEPEGAAKFAESFEQKKRVQLEKTASVADGLITLSVGQLNYRQLIDRVTRAVTISDQRMVETVKYALERLKLVVEPSGAATLAWLRGCAPGAFDGPVVAVISGGNIDWNGLTGLLGGAKA